MELSAGSVFTFDLVFDTLELGVLCFLALWLTRALDLDFGSCLASLLLAWVVSVSRLEVFIKLPVIEFGVANFFFGLFTTFVIFLSLKKFCICSALSFVDSRALAFDSTVISAGGC